MAYIRTKKIKGVEYAYIVETKRYRKKKVKQKPKKYLGRVYRFDRKNMMDFYEFHDIEDVNDYISGRTVEMILNDLVKVEIYNHGFEEKSGKWYNKGCVVNIKKKEVLNEKGNRIALALNEGFLTSYALRKILCFKADYEEFR